MFYFDRKPNMTPFAERRRRLLGQIGSGSVAVLFAAPEQRRSNDTFFPYRQNSYFHYLTGFPEPESVLVLDGSAQTAVLFCRDKDDLSEIWEGFRYGADAAREAFGMDAAYSIATWQEQMPKILQNAQRLFVLPEEGGAAGRALVRHWQKIKNSAAVENLAVCLDEMRLIKDRYETDLLKTAGKISAAAHIRAMQKTRPGISELHIEAELLHEFMRRGARFPAYASIVAGGKNACCLHYTANKDMLQNGDLLLVDAGAEYEGYAGDITRTFPVNGRFGGAQKDLYEVVLAANEAAIAAVRPGAAWADIQQTALNILVRGMVDFKLLAGTVEGNIESGAFKRYYMHGLGHWVGLDVHDAGGRPALLQEGMCTTVEPGIYITAAADIPACFHNIGIRIEDNVLVTESGCENYTAAAPKSVVAIEEIMCG